MKRCPGKRVRSLKIKVIKIVAKNQDLSVKALKSKSKQVSQ